MAAPSVTASPQTGLASPPAHLRLTETEKNLVEALAGALGAVCATWTFYPLDTLKTRLQARAPHRNRAALVSPNHVHAMHLP
jgi:hypothetical protein